MLKAITVLGTDPGVLYALAYLIFTTGRVRTVDHILQGQLKHGDLNFKDYIVNLGTWI